MYGIIMGVVLWEMAGTGKVPIIGTSSVAATSQET